jgi:predicted nucleic acid-binding protein
VASAVFVDTSCLVAIALEEPDSAKLRARILRASTRIASTLAEAELLATLTREHLDHGINAVPGLHWTSPARRLTSELRRVLATGYLRGADAWHIACALYVDPDHSDLVFLTLDDRQRAAAAAVGFRVK